MHPVLKTNIRKIYTVSEVTKDLRGLLEDNFPSVWISGEISNFKIPSSGHFYFTLKDEKAQISAVMFRGSNLSLKFQPEDGMEMVAHGRLSVYEPRGHYQIIVDTLEPKGLGALQLAFEQLKKKLEAEGLFDARHKKPIPILPRKIGIITSPQGAVLHDMVNILSRRFPGIGILINPVRVQGNGAAEEIATAIAEMNQRTDLDLLIVGRGGGALEDLWAFNEEVVVRTIFASDIPIISAVGHETDTTLSDWVADLRAPTPSAAAELAVPERKDLLATLAAYRSRLKTPQKILEDHKLRLDELNNLLDSAQKNLLRLKHHAFRELVLSLPDPRTKLREISIRLDGFSKNLNSVSPLNILKRGYSIVMKKGMAQAVRGAKEVNVGESLDIKLHEGLLQVKVI